MYSGINAFLISPKYNMKANFYVPIYKYTVAKKKSAIIALV